MPEGGDTADHNQPGSHEHQPQDEDALASDAIDEVTDNGGADASFQALEREGEGHGRHAPAELVLELLNQEARGEEDGRRRVDDEGQAGEHNPPAG